MMVGQFWPAVNLGPVAGEAARALVAAVVVGSRVMDREVGDSVEGSEAAVCLRLQQASWHS